MPTLEWIGKKKVINHHNDVTFKLLDKKYSYNTEDESENKIIHGDNLEALKSLLPEYEGRIKCIYIDPPYNTGNDEGKTGWIYNDNVNDPRIRKWLGEVVGKESEDYSRHDKWLCMMYPRLKILSKLLSPDGTIFISLDDNEQASLKFVCDEIFGRSNFVGIITWESSTQPINAGSAKFNLQKKTEFIYVYKYGPKKFKIESNAGNFKYPHNGKLGKCRFEIIEKSDAGGYNRDTMKFPILGQTPREGKRWQIGKDTADFLLSNNRLEIVDGIVKKAVYPEDEIDDVTFTPFWSHFTSSVGTAQSGKNDLNTIMGKPVGFDTVKPIGLIEELLSHIDDDAIVLDSFAGSGTTAHAVLDMNKKDGGHRKFILIELMDYAETITSQRIKNVISGYKYKGKEEIELYSKQLTTKNLLDFESILQEANTIIETNKKNYEKISKPKLIDNHLKVIATKEYDGFKDGLGDSFSYYELGEPLLINGLLNEKVPIEHLRNFIWFTETHIQLPKAKINENKYFLGCNNGAAYFFYYEKQKATTLDINFIKTIQNKFEQYIIYADICLISEDLLEKNHIIFKKIPRDIKKF